MDNNFSSVWHSDVDNVWYVCMSDDFLVVRETKYFNNHTFNSKAIETISCLIQIPHISNPQI